MVFATQYAKRDRRLASGGSPEKLIYTSSYDSDGTLIVEPTGKKNLYAEIQTHKDSCTIKSILKRYESGDIDALNRAQTAYMDVTGMPKNLSEVLNLTLRAENDFAQLPVDVRSKFGHSFSNWLATAGTENWISAMGIETKGANANLEKSIEGGDSTNEPKPE